MGRLARRWLTATVLLTVFLTVVPVGRFLMNILENRFEPARALPNDVEGVIVLGGVIDQFLSRNRGVVTVNGGRRTTDRFAFADLADRYPDAKLVFTGGSGALTDQSLKEADFAAPVLLRMGVALDRGIFESQSRNTAENASMTFGKFCIGTARHMDFGHVCFSHAACRRCFSGRTAGRYFLIQWTISPAERLDRSARVGLRSGLNSGGRST